MNEKKLCQKASSDLIKVQQDLKLEQDKVEAKNREILDLIKKYNNLKVAKISTEYASAQSQGEQDALLRRYSDEQESHRVGKIELLKAKKEQSEIQ